MPNAAALESCSFGQIPVADVDDAELQVELELALEVLGDMERAKRAVSVAVSALPDSSAAQIDNRRDRYIPKEGHRSPTKLLLEGNALLRFLVLHEVELEEIEQEKTMLLSNVDWVKRTTKKNIKTILNRPSFLATILMSQVFCDLKSPETLKIYDDLPCGLPMTKDASSCTKGRLLIFNKAKARFDELLAIDKINSQYFMVSELASSDQADQVERYIGLFLPPPESLAPPQRVNSMTADLAGC